MNRLTKKCMVASAGLHGLLILVLVFASAFTSKRSQPVAEIITLVDAKITDGPTRGGGNPNVQEPPPPAPEPPPAQPVQREPEPEPPAPAPPEPVKLPDPPKPEPEPVRTKEPDVVVPKVTKPAPKPQIDLKPVTKTQAKPTTKPAETKPKQEFVFKPTTRTDTVKPASTPKTTSNNSKNLSRELEKSIGSLSSSIRSKTSSSTSVEMPGPGGEAFVNYRDLVAAIYERAYDRALTRVGEIGDRDDSVDVAVVIGSSGRIISSRITRNSGNPALNKLVKGVLDSVDSVPGFPEGSGQSQRTFNIKFDLKSRRLTG